MRSRRYTVVIADRSSGVVRRATISVVPCVAAVLGIFALPILIGLGVDELSVSLPAIPAVKAQIRALRMDACRELAERALAADSAEDVRALVPDQETELSTTSAGA